MGQEIAKQQSRRAIRENSSVTRDTYERSMEALKGARNSDRVGMEVDHKRGSIKVWSENSSDDH